MSEDEVREKILGNAHIQTTYDIVSAINSLERVLMEKGILDDADIKKIAKYAETKKNEMNESSIKEIYEELERRKKDDTSI